MFVMGRSSSRWWFGSTPALLGAAFVAASCGSFGSPDRASATDGGVMDTNEGGTDGPLPEGASGSDSSKPVANCNGATPFATTPYLFPATQQLESARLGVDGALYVTRTINGKKALGTTKFTDGGVDSTIMPLLPQDLADDQQAMLSTNGLAVVFQSDRAAPGGPSRLHAAIRANVASEFLQEAAVNVVGAPAEDATTELQDPWVSATRVYFTATPDGASKRLQVADVDAASQVLTNARDLFSAPDAMTTADHPVLSSNELELFYVDGNGAIARATRATTANTFPVGAVVAELAASAAKPTWISPDDCDLYYFTNDSAGSGLHRASRR